MLNAYFAACPRGLEAATAAELRALGAEVSSASVAGGVMFGGDRAIGYAANLHSRLASRVLRRLGQARYRNDDDLYKFAARTPWETLIRAEATLRVDVTAQRSPLRSLNFATLRIKDGIVDRLRDQTGTRPSIDTRSPQTRVFAFLDERHVTLYLDLSGEPLFKRGWRGGEDDKGAAPLKENLAAGLLTLAGWQPGVPLLDPFCGSGTIVIEAAQIASGIAAGACRSFGFEHLPDFDASLWARLRASATPGPPTTGAGPLFGSDIDPAAIAQARRNLLRAGLPADAVQFATADAGRLTPPVPPPAMIVSNPPYGERMAVRAAASGNGLAAFGQCLKQAFSGWTVSLLTSDPDVPRQLGMKERRRAPLYNGPIECRLFRFEVFSRDGPQPVPPAGDHRRRRGGDIQ